MVQIVEVSGGSIFQGEVVSDSGSLSRSGSIRGSSSLILKGSLRGSVSLIGNVSLQGSGSLRVSILNKHLSLNVKITIISLNQKPKTAL